MRPRFIIVGVGLLCLMLSQWAEADLYNDGDVHFVSMSMQNYVVDDPPPAAPAYTEVILVGGMADQLRVFNNGRATVNGGFLWGGGRMPTIKAG